MPGSSLHIRCTLSPIMSTLITWRVFARFPHCKFTPLSFHTLLLASKLLRIPHPRGWGEDVKHCLLEEGVSIQITWNSPSYLSLFPHLLIYSIIYLCQYGLMYIYFIPWVIIQEYNLAIRSSSRLAPVSFWLALSFLGTYSYFLAPQDVSHSSRSLPVLALDSTIFLRSRFLLLENSIERPKSEHQVCSLTSQILFSSVT